MPQDLFPNAIRYVGALLLSLGAAWLLTPPAARLAYRYDILDRPGGYKRQSQATPYLGGLAVAVGFLVIGLAVGGANGALLTILGGAVILGVVGLVDDVRQVSPVVRLGFEAIAGVALWVAGIRAGFLGETWFDLPLTVLWLSLYTSPSPRDVEESRVPGAG
jgi:UDP-GlcNAc:undecaprenyl-phosphate GlcNAc-1-phosphate transferase